jgi:hypothetical protein
MLEKLKELLLKHTTELLGGLLTLLFGTIFWQIIPLLLSPLWTRLSPPTLQRILGLSLLSIVALLAYILTLRYKLKTKLKIKFNLFWDKHANPFCPACQALLTNYGLHGYGATNPTLICIRCHQAVAIRDDTAKFMPLETAKSRVLEAW